MWEPHLVYGSGCSCHCCPHLLPLAAHAVGGTGAGQVSVPVLLLALVLVPLVVVPAWRWCWCFSFDKASSFSSLHHSGPEPSVIIQATMM